MIWVEWVLSLLQAHKHANLYTDVLVVCYFSCNDSYFLSYSDFLQHYLYLLDAPMALSNAKPDMWTSIFKDPWVTRDL